MFTARRKAQLLRMWRLTLDALGERVRSMATQSLPDDAPEQLDEVPASVVPDGAPEPPVELIATVVDDEDAHGAAPASDADEAVGPFGTSDREATGRDAAHDANASAPSAAVHGAEGEGVSGPTQPVAACGDHGAGRPPLVSTESMHTFGRVAHGAGTTTFRDFRALCGLSLCGMAILPSRRLLWLGKNIMYASATCQECPRRGLSPLRPQSPSRGCQIHPPLRSYM